MGIADANLVDRNATTGMLPSGNTYATGATAGVQNQQQTSGQVQATNQATSSQNMTPQALAALQGLIQQLSDHPAINDAAATMALQQQGLMPPAQKVNTLTGRADAGSIVTYTDEKGRPIYTPAQFAAAQQRYNAAKQSMIQAGGTVAGGTEESKKQAALKEQIIQNLAVEHATNVANTTAANVTNAETQAQIIKAYGDNLAKAAATYDANKSVVENANKVNQAQNDAAFQVYLANTTQAAQDHARAIEQNAIDRAITEQNLKRSQAMQTQEIDKNTFQQGAYTKEAAFSDASKLAAGYARQLSETLMPTILRSQEASGASGSATTALLANDAAARVTEVAAKTGLDAATQYGQVWNQLAGVNASLTNNQPQLQVIAPVAPIQQIAPVAPLNPALVQNVQQVQAPTQLTPVLPNDQATAAMTNIATSSNQTLDALIASLGVAKGAVTSGATSTAQKTAGTQDTSTQKADNTVENKQVIGVNPNQTQYIQLAPTAPKAVDTGPSSMKITNTTNAAQSSDDFWANYTFQP